MNNPWLHFKQFKAIVSPKSQWEWLQDCLVRNEDSAYGTQHGFATIHSIEDYQMQIPMVAYEDLVPWIGRLTGSENILFSEPVVAYEKTGGSHSGGKLIPYSASGLQDFRAALLPWLAELIDSYKIDHGVAYWALSPALRKNSDNNADISMGGDAIYLGAENVEAFLMLSAVPLSVAEIANLTDWQMVTLCHLIQHNDLRLISIWSPSFFIQLMNGLIVYQDQLRALLLAGGEVAGYVFNQDLGALQRLDRYLLHQNPKELWPALAVISCWADASSAVLVKGLQKIFPDTPIQPKGLLSTEAVITTPNRQGQGLLCLQSNFYEFMDEHDNIHLADKLQHNKDYQVIITTNSGLYRYRTGDQVQCLGYEGNQPILKFLGRVGIVSDHVGEKLTESFVNHCLSAIDQCAMLAFNAEGQGYQLLMDEGLIDHVDAIVAEVEVTLCQNPQYAYARQLNQLTPLTYRTIRDLEKHYIDWQLTQGKRLGDIKMPSLLTQDWQPISLMHRVCD